MLKAKRTTVEKLANAHCRAIHDACFGIIYLLNILYEATQNQYTKHRHYFGLIHYSWMLFFFEVKQRFTLGPVFLFDPSCPVLPVIPSSPCSPFIPCEL